LELTRKEIEDTAEIELIESKSDVQESREDKDKINFILGIEEAEPLQGNITLLDAYYRLGVRTMTLTHSRRNAVGDGSQIFEKKKEHTRGGLSGFGVDVVRRMNELGMVIDISHINEETFWDTVKINNDQPLIASHSNSSTVKSSPRNLSDEQIKAISEVDGVVGAVAGVNIFVGENDSNHEDFLDHIDHMTDVVGVDSVGLGMDYFQYLKKYMIDSELDGIHGVEGLEDDSELGRLPSMLENRGYTEDDIEKICWKNFSNVFEEIL
jgi:membrane dipeptidase